MAKSKIPIDFTYIHYKQKNFTNRYKSFPPPTSGDISGVYASNASFIRGRYADMRGSTKDEGSKELEKMLRAIASLNDTDKVENLIFKEYENLVSKSRESYSMANNFSEKSSSPDRSVEGLQNLLTNLKSFCDEVSKTDGVLLEYMSGMGVAKKDLANPFGGPDSLSILRTNKSGDTSYKNLLAKIKLIEQQVIASSGNTAFKNSKVVYTRTNGKKETVNFYDIFSGIGTQIHNIQGAIGENASETLIRTAIERDFLNVLVAKGEGKITVSGTGSESGVGNKDLGIAPGKGTSTSDVSIRVIKSDDSVDIETVIGISTKAQFRKGVDKSKETTFISGTNLESILRRAGLLGTQQDYLFLNMLNFGMYRKANYLRKFIAARAMKYALGGLGGSDSVYFLHYIDGIERVDAYFDALAKLPIESSKLPRVDVNSSATGSGSSRFIGRKEARALNKKDDGFVDLTPEDKVEMAWIRSRMVRRALLSCGASIRKNL